MAAEDLLSKGERTRGRILEIARQLVLERGFSGTAIDDIIARAGLTKGAFFYHFEGKQQLAEQLMQQYLDDDQRFFDELFSRAEELSEDPLQQMLLFLKMYCQTMADLPSAHPGCLVAAYTYESQQFNTAVVELTRAGMDSWRRQFGKRFDEIISRRKPRLETTAGQLADMLTAVVEGSILMSRLIEDQRLLVAPVLEFRRYLLLLFAD